MNLMKALSVVACHEALQNNHPLWDSSGQARLRFMHAQRPSMESPSFLVLSCGAFPLGHLYCGAKKTFWKLKSSGRFLEDSKQHFRKVKRPPVRTVADNELLLDELVFPEVCEERHDDAAMIFTEADDLVEAACLISDKGALGAGELTLPQFCE